MESTCSERPDPLDLSLWAMFREGQASRARTENRLKFAARALPERLARSSENRANIERKSAENRSASEPCEENSIFSFPDATWRRFGPPRRAPGRSQALFLASRVTLGHAAGAPGTRRGRPRTLPRRSRDPFETPLAATKRPERVPGPIFDRF